MENEDKIQNEEEKKTPEGTDQPENKISSDENQEDVKVEISAKELETYKKKSADFDASIELKRLSKIQNREQLSGEGKTEINELVEKINNLEQIVSNSQASQKNGLLKEGYRQFISDNKWADDDNIFANISQDFDITGLNTKEEIVSKLKSVAISKFPNEYENSITAKAKAQALADASNIGVGGGTSGGGENHFAGTGKSEEDKMSDKFMGNFPAGWAINKK